MEKSTRHIERIKKKLIVNVENENCVMVDMSKFGMRLTTPFLLKKRDIIVSFQMENVALELSCHVCWIKKEVNIYRQSQYQVGLYIPEPPVEYIQLVESLTHW